MLSNTEETSNCEQEAQEKFETAGMRVKVYKRRFWMLFLFSSLSLLCGMMYPLYTITADVTKCYYSVSQEAVNWTGLLYMVMYLILVVPVSSSIHKFGLRKTVLCISLFNSIASACQFATLKPNNFAYVMVSQFFGSLANVSVLALPPVLASVWFPSRQLSRACAFGVMSNQMGVGLGFLLTPFMVSSDCSKPELIEEGKFKVAITLSVLNTAVLGLILFTFQKEPLYPPNEAQEFKVNSRPEPYINSLVRTVKNNDFRLLLLLHGVVVATYFILEILLNEITILYFPGKQKEIGVMGAILTVSGLAGSVTAGYILDLTHKFKETSAGICMASFLSYICFSGFLLLDKIWIQFITIGLLGFFLTSYLTVGLEYGIELTYPESEIVSASLLILSSMVCGIILTELTSFAMVNVSGLAANGIVCINLFCCSVISRFMSTDYKRSKKTTDMMVVVT